MNKENYLYAKKKEYELYHGTMQEVLETFEENSIDSIVCDPPYELNFMGKGWDNSGVAFNVETWKHCFDVLKPGGYLLAFGGSRTYHRICCAIEDAGFEIRDCIMWLYGSGFPKSMSLSKGLESKEKLGNAGTRNKRKIEQSCEGESYKLKQTNNGAMGEVIETTRKEYIPGTNLAKQWQGWGTCLKPAYEPIIVARKPFKGSLVDNVIENGVGGINIDECRVGNEERTYLSGKATNGNRFGKYNTQNNKEVAVNGRFPANVILTYDETDFEEVCGGFPETKSQKRDSRYNKATEYTNTYTPVKSDYRDDNTYNDEGSASRYFYCAKASKKDRNEGLENFEDKMPASAEFRPNHMEKALKGEEGNPFGRWKPTKNIHPTVKPTELMQYLVRLVTPKGGTVLDCFMGSGSTGKATMYENKERNADYKFIGIEMTDEYLPICEARISYALNNYMYEEDKEETNFEEIEEKKQNEQLTIFDFIEE